MNLSINITAQKHIRQLSEYMIGSSVLILHALFAYIQYVKTNIDSDCIVPTEQFLYITVNRPEP